MNSQELFSLALNLQSPWYLKSVEFKETRVGQRELHLSIDFAKGSQFVAQSGEMYGAHDTVERTWRHMNFFEHRCYLHCRVPRIKTKEGIETVSVPWARPNSGFTLMFEGLVMGLIEQGMTVNRVSRYLGETPPRLWRVFDYWIGLAYAQDDPSSITALGVDETSAKRGHRYVTVGVDLEVRRVIHVVEGRDHQTLEKIGLYLKGKGVDLNQITQASIDLSPAYISGLTKYFPAANITFDRFHVVKLLNEAMDKVRRQERKEHNALKGHRYTFLKSKEKLSKKRRASLDELLASYPTLGEAYRLKELFNDLWSMPTTIAASAFLDVWIQQVLQSKIIPFIDFIKTVSRHRKGIINFIDSKISNGILEAINSKIQLIKRQARGFRDTSNFINMIYFQCAKLKFNYPLQTL